VFILADPINEALKMALFVVCTLFHHIT